MKPVGGIRGLFGYPRPSLAHALTKFERESAPGRDEAADAFGYVLGGETFNLRSLDSAMLFWLGRLITREFLLRHIPADCDQIIEIGGGRGTNLFHLWLAGAPPNAEYCCLEPAEEARQKARHFASLASLRLLMAPLILPNSTFDRFCAERELSSSLVVLPSSFNLFPMTSLGA
jgi:hypothetical protein